MVAMGIVIASVTHAQFKQASFQASGLTCSLCSNAINKALKTLPYADTVTTDLNTNTFTVIFKKNAIIDPDQIVKKVEDAGFSVAKFWLVADWDHQEVGNNAHVNLGGLEFHFLNTSSRVLNGPIRLQVIDRNYVAAKEFKKNAVYTTMPCYQTGRMGSCCPGTMKEGRIYHVTI